MTIYIILPLLIFIYALYLYNQNENKQSRKLFLFLSFSSMALVLGLRGSSVGEDTAHYLNIFMNAKSIDWENILLNSSLRTPYFTNQYGYTDTIEDGFLVITKIVHWFTDSGQIFLFVIAALTCGLFAKFIYDNNEHVFYPTYIFLCESMFMFSFNGIRQMLAGAITIQAYTLLKKRALKKALIVILVAALIHNVSLIALILFPVMLIEPQNKQKSFKFLATMIIFIPFLVIFFQTVIIKIFPRYISYFTTNYWTNNLRGISFLLLTEFLLILIMYKKHFKYKASFILSLLTLLGIILELVGLKITMFSRVGYFFRPYLILFFPESEKYFSINSRKIIRIGMMILLLSLYFSYASTPSRTYHFFWND